MFVVEATDVRIGLRGRKEFCQPRGITEEVVDRKNSPDKAGERKPDL